MHTLIYAYSYDIFNYLNDRISNCDAYLTFYFENLVSLYNIATFLIKKSNYKKRSQLFDVITQKNKKCQYL